MLFQNSCDVPFGITAIVNFFFAFFDPKRLQLNATTDANTTNIEMILRTFISHFCFDQAEVPTASPAATKGLFNQPTLSITTSITSPGRRNTGGLRAKPTPGGVPVAITSPGSSVMVWERNSINSGTPKINWSVLESCIVLPLSISLIESLCGSGISSVVTIVCPIGAKVSQDFPRCHWPSAN